MPSSSSNPIPFLLKKMRNLFRPYPPAPFLHRDNTDESQFPTHELAKQEFLRGVENYLYKQNNWLYGEVTEVLDRVYVKDWGKLLHLSRRKFVQMDMELWTGALDLKASTNKVFAYARIARAPEGQHTEVDNRAPVVYYWAAGQCLVRVSAIGVVMLVNGSA